LSGRCIDTLSRFCPSVGARVEVPEGVRLTHEDLWNMDWFVDGVVYMGEMGE